jgi:hypothetical protein
MFWPMISARRSACARIALAAWTKSGTTRPPKQLPANHSIMELIYLIRRAHVIGLSIELENVK